MKGRLVRLTGHCQSGDHIRNALFSLGKPMPIDYEKRDRVAYITLNNPAKANILDKQTSDEISEAWIDLWEDRDIRCAIVTGKGDRHFCGGHNLAPRPDLTEEDREYLRTQRIYWPLAGTVHGQTTGVDGRMGDHYPRVWKPVIAAVNGWAAGAGLYMVLASTDIRLASAEHARFKFGLLSQGWLGHGPGASLLIKQLRYIDAMKMLLTDEPVDAAEALRIGLINEVVPHEKLMERAEESLREAGIEKAHLFIYADNPAIDFYSRVGWHLREDIEVMSKVLIGDEYMGTRRESE